MTLKRKKSVTYVLMASIASLLSMASSFATPDCDNEGETGEGSCTTHCADGTTNWNTTLNFECKKSDPLPNIPPGDPGWNIVSDAEYYNACSDHGGYEHLQSSPPFTPWQSCIFPDGTQGNWP